MLYPKVALPTYLMYHSRRHCFPRPCVSITTKWCSFMGSQRGHLQILDALLLSHADCNSTDDTGATALQHAAQEGAAQMVARLLYLGFDINQGWCDGPTPKPSKRFPQDTEHEFPLRPWGKYVPCRDILEPQGFHKGRNQDVTRVSCKSFRRDDYIIT